MDWIDTHCHLDSFVEKRLLGEVLQRAEAAGVRRLITVGTDAGDWGLYQRLATEHPGRISWTAGLHPGHVGEDYRDALACLAPFWTEDPLPVAVGEIGLDFFRLPKDEEQAARMKQWQGDAFRYQLDWAHQVDAPVVVHSRAAFAECVALIDQVGFPWERVVFHCFAGDGVEVAELVSRGGRASFTGIVTFKSAEAMREAVRAQGLERLMLETDAPYLAPEPHRGKVCEPAMMVRTAERCAELLGVTPEVLAERTSANAAAFFGLPQARA